MPRGMPLRPTEILRGKYRTVAKSCYSDYQPLLTSVEGRRWLGFGVEVVLPPNPSVL